MIRAHITDTLAFGQIDPEVVARYLASHGWTIQRHFDRAGGSNLWVKKGPADEAIWSPIEERLIDWSEVLLPETREAHDHCNRMRDLVGTLAAEEGRSERPPSRRQPVGQSGR